MGLARLVVAVVAVIMMMMIMYNRGRIRCSLEGEYEPTLRSHRVSIKGKCKAG